MKIKHNFKILEDGLTVKGQVLETIFEEGEERGDKKEHMVKSGNFRLVSSVWCPYLYTNALLVWGDDQNGDLGIVEKTFDTKEEAKQILAYINEFTVVEENPQELKPGMEVCISYHSEKVAIENWEGNKNIKYYYIGKTKDGSSVVERWDNGVFSGVRYFPYCVPVPKEEEKPKPKYKIGDRVYHSEFKTYSTITNIGLKGDSFIYNGEPADHIRPATPDEIDLYFN